ncbi:MAG: hypothetical protein HZA48_02305 [Planctomycetes bacterium]|nr:hypothetical protein [Planctomycetota bacterium]
MVKSTKFNLNDQDRTVFQLPESPEPNIQLCNNAIHKGYRFRAVGSKVYTRPINETFHEFIIGCYLLGLYGEKWRQEQMKLAENKRHVLIEWVNSWREFKSSLHDDKHKIKEHLYAAPPSGKVKALMQFAYDIFCLEAINKLPDFWKARIKNNKEFQGARYEIAVAAILARAGFEITFLDEQAIKTKHCEMFAKHKKIPEEIAVEVKSRHRKGVLNENGAMSDIETTKGDVEKLIKDACSQKPGNVPFFIFVDVNVNPIIEQLPLKEKQWVKDVKTMLSRYGEPTSEKPTPFNSLIFTNFAYYYGGELEEAPSGEVYMENSPFPEVQCSHPEIFDEIWKSLTMYAEIPNEV